MYYIFVVYKPENSEIPFGIGCARYWGEIRGRGAQDYGNGRTKGREKKNFDLINF